MILHNNLLQKINVLPLLIETSTYKILISAYIHLADLCERLAKLCPLSGYN